MTDSLRTLPRTTRGIALAVVAALAGALLWSAPAGGVAGFGDVPSGQYYTRAVQWMVDEEITAGVTPSCFAPGDTVDRGQAAAFIWRMEGEPSASGPHGFADVVQSWQHDAVAWMVDEGITFGTTAVTYSPAMGLTRGQIAAFLHRLAGTPSAPRHSFVDVHQAWQHDAVSWMVDEGITFGTTATTFAPERALTRADLAAFLYRYNGEPAVTVDPASPACGGSSSGGGGGGGGGGSGGGSGQTYVRTFYVDVNHPSASNSNPGTEAAPWRTLVHAADVARSGDRILVKAGVYDHGEVEIESSGVILSAHPGHEHQAIVRGEGIVSHGNSNLTINGFRIEDTDEHGIRVVGPGASGIDITNNQTHETEKSGISVRGVTGNADPGNYDNMRDVFVFGNVLELSRNSEVLSVGSGVVDIDIAYNTLRMGDPDGGSGDEGISLKEGVRDARVYGNVAHGLADKAVSIDGGSSDHDPLVTDIEIFGNTFYNLPTHGMWVTTEGQGDVDGVHIHHNVIHSNDGNGILVYGHPGGLDDGGTVRNVTIEFNTVWNNGTHSGQGGIRVDHPSAPGVVIRDNIAWANSGYGIRGDAGTSVSRRNLCQEAALCDRVTDPLFVSPPSDFGLRAGSPAIGAGAGGANLGAS